MRVRPVWTGARTVLMAGAGLSPRVFCAPSGAAASPLGLRRRVSVMRQLLDVLHETEEFSLPVDLLPTAEREAIQSLVRAEVAKHRFHSGEPPGMTRPLLGLVDPPVHARPVRVQTRRGLARKERDLARRRRGPRAQTLRAERAGSTVALRPLKAISHVALRHQLLALPIERLACGTYTGPRDCIIAELARCKDRRRVPRRTLVVQWIGVVAMPGLRVESLVQSAARAPRQPAGDTPARTRSRTPALRRRSDATHPRPRRLCTLGSPHCVGAARAAIDGARFARSSY